MVFIFGTLFSNQDAFHLLTLYIEFVKRNSIREQPFRKKKSTNSCDTLQFHSSGRMEQLANTLLKGALIMKGKKILTAVCGVCLAASLFAGAVQAEEAQPAALSSDINVETLSETVSGTIHVDKLSTGAIAYVYIPDNELYGIRATAAPILIVYGNEPFSSATALETAYASGLAAIADMEQTPVVFVNPLGETWAEEDAASLEAAKNLFADGTDNAVRMSDYYLDGKNEAGAYAGSYTRLYLFGCGAGADFIYSQLSKGVAGGAQFFGNATFKPHAAFLMNPSSTEAIDLAESDVREVPVVIVNGTEEIISAYTALNKSVETVELQSDVAEGFDAALLTQAYLDVMEHYMVRVQCSAGLDYCETSLFRITSNDELGLKEEKKEYTFEDGTALSYYQWASGEEGLPLLVVMHGSGSSAECLVWSASIQELASEYGFNLISLENYSNGDLDNDKLIEAIDFAAEETKSDMSRLYVGGFSMGSVKTWALTSSYTDHFAGAIAMNGFNSGMSEDGFTAAIPFFAYGGAESFLAGFFEFPNADNFAQEAALFAANNVTAELEFNPELTWGMEPSNTYTIEVTDLPDLAVEISEFASEDGTVMTAFGSASSAGHEPLKAAIEEGWKLISKFRRAEDGSVQVIE